MNTLEEALSTFELVKGSAGSESAKQHPCSTGFTKARSVTRLNVRTP